MSVDPEALSSFSIPKLEVEPIIALTVGSESFTLTRHNTILRTFFVGEGAYDHLAHKLPTGEWTALRVTTPETKHLREVLELNDFPILIDEELDQATINWFADIAAQELDGELRLLLG